MKTGLLNCQSRIMALKVAERPVVAPSLVTDVSKDSPRLSCIKVVSVKNRMSLGAKPLTAKDKPIM